MNGLISQRVLLQRKTATTFHMLRVLSIFSCVAEKGFEDAHKRFIEHDKIQLKWQQADGTEECQRTSAKRTIDETRGLLAQAPVTN